MGRFDGHLDFIAQVPESAVAAASVVAVSE